MIIMSSRSSRVGGLEYPFMDKFSSMGAPVGAPARLHGYQRMKRRARTIALSLRGVQAKVGDARAVRLSAAATFDPDQRDRRTSRPRPRARRDRDGRASGAFASVAPRPLMSVSAARSPNLARAAGGGLVTVDNPTVGNFSRLSRE